MKVFVYGTLLRGFGNHEYCLKDSTFVKEDSLPKFEMRTHGSYPGIRPLVWNRATSKVHGEIYEVNEQTLERLDHLEGIVPEVAVQNGRPRDSGNYTREVVKTESGEEVFVYVKCRCKDYMKHVIRDGRWKSFTQKHPRF
jgi:gamma-glutamylcyclotransferase (GGCT)/AIG2-like uncharacterized protein YtfP